MKKAIIESIESVKVRGNETIVYVSLSGMRADLSQCIEIHPSEIKSWHGVDGNGWSTDFELKPGIEIFYEEISFRVLKGASFEDK